MKILLVERKQADHSSFGLALKKKGYQVQIVSNGGVALARMSDIEPDVVIVDAASLRTSGKRICQSLRKKLDGVVIVLIVDGTQPVPEKSFADVSLVLPFTVQKLINRIKTYLPSDEKDLLKAGPICLNLKQKQVNCLGNSAKLTSRQVTLLKTLMEHPGEVIERKDLFSSVWDTEYTGDTRSLDVHIGWLRKALEADPHNPKFLKTVRGVGYRLDI